jgi:ferredoxin-thioredoxin reductase catalytic subunit
MLIQEPANKRRAEEARERVERMVSRYVARGPYCLNPDPVTVEHVLAGLTRNLIGHGRWYCPCREVTGEPERDRANICPCPQHRTDIARDGVCECGIFVSKEYATRQSPDSTPHAREER